LADLIDEFVQSGGVICPRAKCAAQPPIGRRLCKQSHRNRLAIGKPRRLIQFNGLAVHLSFENRIAVFDDPPLWGILSIAGILYHRLAGEQFPIDSAD
jgi:hypothetical protein